MRLTLELGPLNLDISLTLGEQAGEFEEYQDAGTTSSTAIAGPSEVPWEDAGSPHQFQPENKRLGFR